MDVWTKSSTRFSKSSELHTLVIRVLIVLTIVVQICGDRPHALFRTASRQAVPLFSTDRDRVHNRELAPTRNRANGLRFAFSRCAFCRAAHAAVPESRVVILI